MTSHTTERFRSAFRSLPEHIQRRARESYQLWKTDPWHSSLQFKQVHPSRPIFSVRIGIGWRALGVRCGEAMIWFWIGSHSDYDKLLSQM